MKVLICAAIAVVTSQWVKAGLVDDLKEIRNSGPVSKQVNEFTKRYPIEADWLNQAVPRPQVDGKGAGLGVLKYISSAGDIEFIKGVINNAIAELVNGKTAYQQRLKTLLLSEKKSFDSEYVELFVDVCRARRAQRLKTVVENYPKIMFIKRISIRPSFYAYTEGQSDGQSERHYSPGSALCMLDMSSGEPVVTTLIDAPDGVIRDLDVSYDADKALFAWKKGKDIRQDDYHLYEMDLATKAVRQLTFGKGVADYEGRYLPNGDLVFSSSRCVQTIDCWKTETSNMYTSDKDGKLIRRLGFDQVHTTYPTVMNDGRILYTRWDYNDRGQLYPQPLFQMNFDGTGQTEFYGNNSWFPTTIHHARQIPNSNKVLAVLHGHHTWQAGKLALIDRSKGTQEASGVQIIAPVRETKPVRVDKYGQDEELFRHPYPLNENEYIVTMTLDNNARKNRNSKFGLYYIDRDGNRELLHYDQSVSTSHPTPVIKRTRPQLRPSTVDFTKSYGTYFMQDVYVGPGLKGVKRGTIKKLRVVALDFRAAHIGATRSKGEAGGSLNSTPVSVGNATWDPKIILGETPVYEDGSAMYKVPANTPVYFQCIDDKGQVAATMRSWSTLMPGETFSCVGCHEDKNYTPPVSRTTTAMKNGPQELKPFYDIKGGFSFNKVIQPILDKHCISCHDGKTEKKGKIQMDLTNKVVTGGDAKRKWATSYLNLVGVQKVDRFTRGQPDRKILNWISTQSRPSMLPPYHAGSGTSKVVEMLRSGHGKTKLTQSELDKFCAWIDLAVPFCGDYLEANYWSKPDFERYIKYQRKREAFAEEVRRNTELLYKKNTGKTLKLFDPPPRYEGRKPNPSVGSGEPAIKHRTSGSAVKKLKNVALASAGATATANDYYKKLPHYAPENVINGNRANAGHGKKFPSWGPYKGPKNWLKIQFKNEVEVNKAVIYVRADFKPYTKKNHDSWWKKGVLEFSDGSTHPFTLKKTKEGQTISFPKRRTSFIKITGLVPAEDKWCAFTEVEVWGKDK